MSDRCVGGGSFSTALSEHSLPVGMMTSRIEQSVVSLGDVSAVSRESAVSAVSTEAAVSAQKAAGIWSCQQSLHR